MGGEVVIVGTKETFLITSLRKKLDSAGIPSGFALMEINAINAAFDRAALLAFYFDNTEHIQSDVLHFVSEHAMERSLRIVLIGEKNDTDEALKLLPRSYVLEIFGRPLDADSFITSVSAFLSVQETIRKKNILIVDDDATYMGLIRDWLKDDYSVALANSGMQAITYLSMNKADLILLDFEMPVTDGPKVLEMLRCEPNTARIPVIVLTGHNDKESVMKVVSLKPAGYLLKTIQRGDLLKEISKFFRSREQ